ncbi:hypothetical protein Tco_0641785 [Tanacetum coccineum]
MPSLTMKWLFSQFRAKLMSSHRLSILSKWVRHVEKELPKTEKSSINTSIVYSIHDRGKIASYILWNVPGGHYIAKVAAVGKDPYGQVNDSFMIIGSWLIPMISESFQAMASCGTVNTYKRAGRFSRILKALA